MDKLTDETIIEASWKNVHPWVAAIQNGEIATRLLITNKVIIDAVMERAAKTVLDVGCGEGWLVRELAAKGIDALGIDAISECIEIANKQKTGRFKVLSYEKTSSHELNEKFDVVVCNFSLLGEKSVNCLFQQIPSLLNESGLFIVQTVHPVVGCGNYK
jgi:2-polyprenyl-3-methyl-5-hydroxy-6-metoxy-1,4-benzoquinol methylase